MTSMESLLVRYLAAVAAPVAGLIAVIGISLLVGIINPFLPSRQRIHSFFSSIQSI